MKHIFLTGDIQVGKSTIIRKFLEAHPELRIGGFRTVWQEKRMTHSNSLHIVPATGACVPTEENRIGLREGVFPDRTATDYPLVFDTVGVGLLQNLDNCDLIIMDEIGLSENEADVFVERVLDILDGDTPVLGVVQPKTGTLTGAVRNHPKVHLVLVTKENREMILQRMLEGTIMSAEQDEHGCFVEDEWEELG